MGKIIAIVGLTGSGKSVATDFFEEKGFSKIRFGQITMDILKEQGKEVNEANEKEVREGLRKELGMAAYAIKNISKINDAVTGGDVVLDGLYSWAEYKVLKKEYGNDMKILSVQCCPKTRYSRLAERQIRPLTNEEAESRDHAEIENIEKAGPIVMADFTIINEGSVGELKNELEKVHSNL